MATMNALNTRMYLLPDSRSKRDSSPESMRTVALFVNGPTAVMTLFLPTVDLHEPGVVLLNQFDKYISDIQGYALTKCDVSVHQRRLLLHLLLGYRTFYNGVPPADPDAYPIFVALIADAAASADDHEAADDVIVEIVAWLHNIFPEAVFTDDSIPLLNHDAPEDREDRPRSSPSMHSTPQPAVAPRGPASEVQSDIFVGHVLTNDPGLAQLFPEGVPERLLQAVLNGTTAPAERSHANAARAAKAPAEARKPPPPFPTASSSPSARPKLQEESGALPPSAAASTPPSTTPDSALADASSASASDVRMEAAEDSDSDSVPGLETVYGSSDGEGDGEAESSRPPVNHSTRAPLTTEQRNAIVRSLLLDRGSAGVPGGLPLQFVRDVLDGRIDVLDFWTSPSAGLGDDEGGYASGDSMPSLGTVSDSSDDEDEEYVDDDDEYYDD